MSEFPQFATTIDGQNIHFLYVRSPEPGALPLIVCHGYPGLLVGDVCKFFRTLR